MGSHIVYSPNMMIPPTIKVSIPSEMKGVDNFVVNFPPFEKIILSSAQHSRVARDIS